MAFTIRNNSIQTLVRKKFEKHLVLKDWRSLKNEYHEPTTQDKKALDESLTPLFENLVSGRDHDIFLSAYLTYSGNKFFPSKGILQKIYQTMTWDEGRKMLERDSGIKYELDKN